MRLKKVQKIKDTIRRKRKQQSLLGSGDKPLETIEYQTKIDSQSSDELEQDQTSSEVAKPPGKRSLECLQEPIPKRRKKDSQSSDELEEDETSFEDDDVSQVPESSKELSDSSSKSVRKIWFEKYLLGEVASSRVFSRTIAIKKDTYLEDLIQQLRLSESNRIYLRKSEDDPLDDKFFKLSLDGSRVTIKISKVDFDELYVGTLLDDLLKTNLRVGSPNAPIILIDVEEYQKLLEKSKLDPVIQILKSYPEIQIEKIKDITNLFEKSFDENAFDKIASKVIEKESNQLLKIDIPCGINNQPDLLRLAQPKESPSKTRVDRIFEILKEQHVFAPAVSGAGKTRLAFDLAQNRYSFYFDMNGTHGKVKQGDVQRFMYCCAKIASYGAEKTIDEIQLLFDQVIGALILSRWVTLVMARQRNQQLSPSDWLWIQTDNPSLCCNSFDICLSLSSDHQNKLRDILRSQDQDSVPILLIDEAQQLLKYEDFFRSTSKREKHPLGHRVVDWIEVNSLKCYVCGIDLKLRDFNLFYSNVGGISKVELWYDFDFLKLGDNIDGTLVQYFDHILNLDWNDSRLAASIASLQGRPRFAATAITMFLETGKTEVDDLIDSINEYIQYQMTELRPNTAIGLWSRLYEEHNKVKIERINKTMFDVALNLLLESIIHNPSHHRLDPKELELVSHGVTMLNDRGKGLILAEPLILSAGMTFCLRTKVDIAASLIDIFKSNYTDAQARGRLLEILAAVRLYERPNRLSGLSDQLSDIFPTHRPKGLLVGVSLIDSRVNFKNLDKTPKGTEKYWISLPDNNAGPDLVMPRMVMSFKWTETGKSVPAEESRKAIKTTSPLKFYTKENGELYSDGNAWREKHEEVKQLSKNWQSKIVRVRVELPESAPSLKPEHKISSEVWGLKSKDDDAEREDRNDLMVYINLSNASCLFGDEFVEYLKSMKKTKK